MIFHPFPPELTVIFTLFNYNFFPANSFHLLLHAVHLIQFESYPTLQVSEEPVCGNTMKAHRGYYVFKQLILSSASNCSEIISRVLAVSHPEYQEGDMSVSFFKSFAQRRS
jgi:hypothetical protein